VLTAIFPENSTFHHATHTFDVQQENGTAYAYLMVRPPPRVAESLRRRFVYTPLIHL
jgi:hypothetical protein